MRHNRQSTRPVAKSNRRDFFSHVGGGLCGTALASLLGEDLFGDASILAAETEVASGQRAGRRHVYDLQPRKPHFAPRATSVIQLFMNGGPSPVDLFDPKPMLVKHHGEKYFDKIAGDVENPQNAGALMRSPFKFNQHGQCGMWVSEVMPQLAKCVDDIALVRSMYSPSLTHEPAIWAVQSGSSLPGSPAMGAWVSYGLGSVSQNLPAFVVLNDPRGLPVNGTQNWQPGYLPPVYQGTRFRANGSPVLDLKPQYAQPTEVTLMQRDLLERLDRLHQNQRVGNPKLDARIASYALAARMQMSTSEAVDLARESKQTRDLYGIGQRTTDSYGRRCLVARRLVERGVRFVQICISGQIWDNHNQIGTSLKTACDQTDKPVAGLLMDLKQRGLLDKTLVVWGGEMGRLPIAELRTNKDYRVAGRDHNKHAMLTWMAGGGIKGGVTHGESDEIGLKAVTDRVSVHDYHATILHQLGLDFSKLSFHRNGLDEKLTGVTHPRIIKEIIS